MIERRRMVILSIIGILMLVFGWRYIISSSSTSMNETVFTVAYRDPDVQLHYSGYIQPKRTTVLTMPVDGVILERHIPYGQFVKKNEPLFSISAKTLLKECKEAIASYVKAKSEFEHAEIQLKESQFLHHHQLISEDEFKSKQRQFQLQQLSFLQSKESLRFFLKQFGKDEASFYALTISRMDELKQALNLDDAHQRIAIHAPNDGVLLSAGKTEEDSKKLHAGDFIKQGDALALLADVSGVMVKIRVHESMVHHIRVHDSVTIMGQAFSGHTLSGQIVEIDHQADVAQAGQPSFLVRILVPRMTPTQQHAIHVGMSADVHIKLKQAPQLMVPIKALHERAGNMMVTVLNPKNSKKEERLVEVGETTMDFAVITHHLKEGEKIVFSS